MFALFALFFFLIARAGLLAAITTAFAFLLLETFPFTWPLNVWYGGAGLTGVAVIAALAIAAFRVATVGSVRSLPARS